LTFKHATCGSPHGKLEPDDINLSSSREKKFVFFVPEFRF